MTMHLEGPWMTTTRYSKRPHKKWASSEAKQRAEREAREWAELSQRLEDLAPNFAGRRYAAQAMPRGAFQPLQSRSIYPPGREPQQHIPSRDSGVGVAAAPAAKVYTGSECIGVTVLHKSCLQPVFDKQSAVDAAKMRR